MSHSFRGEEARVAQTAIGAPASRPALRRAGAPLRLLLLAVRPVLGRGLVRVNGVLDALTLVLEGRVRERLPAAVLARGGGEVVPLTSRDLLRDPVERDVRQVGGP